MILRSDQALLPSFGPGTNLATFHPPLFPGSGSGLGPSIRDDGPTQAGLGHSYFKRLYLDAALYLHLKLFLKLSPALTTKLGGSDNTEKHTSQHVKKCINTYNIFADSEVE